MDQSTASGATSDDGFKVARFAAPLRHGVVESIRTAIALGRFRAGQRLPERALCDLTGVSRTLVREALRQLESEGLVTVLPHRGPIVAGLTPEQAEGIYEVRCELEGLASLLFAQRADAQARAALQAALEGLKSASLAADPIAWLTAKTHFYDCIIAGSGNAAVGQSLHLLNCRITVLRATSLEAPGRAEQSIAELGALVEALMARDGASARDAARHHVRMAASVAIAHLRRPQGEGMA